MIVHVFTPPLKQTADVAFEREIAAADSDARSLLETISVSRRNVLALFSKESITNEVLGTALNEYLSYVLGFADDQDSQGASSRSNALGKLRYAVPFTWTNTMATPSSSTLSDVVFDVASILEDAALWHAKKAAALLNQADPAHESVVLAHVLLKRAAGICSAISKSILPRFGSGSPLPPDMVESSVQTYGMQLAAEAQEVSLERSIRKPCEASFIASLAADTARRYRTAAGTVNASGNKKWFAYVSYKALAMEATAGTYHAEHLFTVNERCGDAISIISVALGKLDEAESRYKDFLRANPKTKGAATVTMPPMLIALRKFAEARRGKMERENGFIYKQRIPVQLPDGPTPRSVLTCSSGDGDVDAWAIPQTSTRLTPAIINSLKPLSKPAKKPTNASSGSRTNSSGGNRASVSSGDRANGCSSM